MVQLIPVDLIDAGPAAAQDLREEAAAAVSSADTEDLPF
jgi:hypothetical protein